MRHFSELLTIRYKLVRYKLIKISRFRKPIWCPYIFYKQFHESGSKLQYCLFFFFWPSHVACGILISWSGKEPAPPCSRIRVLTTGLPWKSQHRSSKETLTGHNTDSENSIKTNPLQGPITVEEELGYKQRHVSANSVFSFLAQLSDVWILHLQVPWHVKTFTGSRMDTSTLSMKHKNVVVKRTKVELKAF